MSIAEFIRKARMEKGITQESAAQYLLVSRQTISNWENGKSLPDIVSVIRMSDLYGLSLDQLLKGDQKMMEKIEKDQRVAQASQKWLRFGLIAVGLGALILTLGQIFSGNPVIEFLSGALPWVLLGIALLFGITYLNGEEKAESHKND